MAGKRIQLLGLGLAVLYMAAKTGSVGPADCQALAMGKLGPGNCRTSVRGNWGPGLNNMDTGDGNVFVSGNMCVGGGNVSVSGNASVSGNICVEDGNASVSGNMEAENYTASVSGNMGTDRAQIMCLQVPDNLDFCVDPCNLSGRGQVYSERFAIENSGSVGCALHLRNIACQSAGVCVVGGREEVYARDRANIYLELAFENGDLYVLSAEGQEYTVLLEPGEELAFCLRGAVNEQASEGWEGKEMSVSMKYSWAAIE